MNKGTVRVWTCLITTIAVLTLAGLLWPEDIDMIWEFAVIFYLVPGMAYVANLEDWHEDIMSKDELGWFIIKTFFQFIFGTAIVAVWLVVEVVKGFKRVFKAFSDMEK
jgi:hypothetical protein